MNKNKKVRLINYWEKMQKRGVIKHILISGTAFALIFNIFTFDLDKLELFTDKMFLLKFTGKFLLSAILFGIGTWWLTKWQYNKVIKEKTKKQN